MPGHDNRYGRASGTCLSVCLWVYLSLYCISLPTLLPPTPNPHQYFFEWDELDGAVRHGDKVCRHPVRSGPAVVPRHRRTPDRLPAMPPARPWIAHLTRHDLGVTWQREREGRKDDGGRQSRSEDSLQPPAPKGAKTTGQGNETGKTRATLRWDDTECRKMFVMKARSGTIGAAAAPLRVSVSQSAVPIQLSSSVIC